MQARVGKVQQVRLLRCPLRVELECPTIQSGADLCERTLDSSHEKPGKAMKIKDTFLCYFYKETSSRSGNKRIMETQEAGILGRRELSTQSADAQTLEGGTSHRATPRVMEKTHEDLLCLFPTVGQGGRDYKNSLVKQPQFGMACLFHHTPLFTLEIPITALSLFLVLRAQLAAPQVPCCSLMPIASLTLHHSSLS